MKLKKSIKILIIILISIVVLTATLIGLYLFGLKPVSKSSDSFIYVVEAGEGYKDIVDELYNNGLIRSKFAGYTYVFLHKDMTLKAGSYELAKNMSTDQMFEKLASGDVIRDLRITFVEGKRLKTYAKQIAEAFGYNEEEVLKQMNDKAFIQELIDHYWFLSNEILNENIYYPLEGYLFPDTYDFKANVAVRDIVIRMINNMDKKLTPYKEDITTGKYNVHQILSMASIIELEGNSEVDRKDISRVIFNRLDKNMSLGMDVTTYYAVKKDMGSDLLVSDFNTVNPYNTRASGMEGKLPIGPICNPSAVSINAVFAPSDNDNLYFYADIKTGKVYFAKTHEEFLKIIEEVG